jgi:DNA-binding NtrC family response regulator
MQKHTSSIARNRPTTATHPRHPWRRPLHNSGRREDLPSPVILVVVGDSLLRWALYEALVAARFRVLACEDEAHAHEILPKVDATLSLAIIDDGTWPMTTGERTWLHALWPDLPIVVLAHHGQGLEHRVKELGLAELLLKPFDVPHLVQVVERFLAAPVGTARHVAHANAG